MSALPRHHPRHHPLRCDDGARGRIVVSTAVLAMCQAMASIRAQSSITIAVDGATNRHPINPNIYGVAHATTAQLNDLNSPLNRNGGNNTTRYNWQQNADNRGSDWYFEGIADSSATPGERGDRFITSTRAGKRRRCSRFH